MISHISRQKPAKSRKKRQISLVSVLFYSLSLTNLTLRPLHLSVVME